MGERLDFHNPFLAAAIVTTDGKRFPLWVKTEKSAIVASRLGATSSLAFVQQLTVEIQLAYLPIIKAVLTPPYRDAINFLNSNLIEWGQSRLEVQFGYIVAQPGPNGTQGGRAVLSEIYSGILLKPEVVLGGEVSITLNAQGVGGFSAVRGEGNLTLNNVTRREIVLELTKPFKIEIDDSEVRNAAPLEAVLVDEWNKIKLNTFVQGGDSYWTALLKIIHEAGLRSYLIGNVLRILPPSFIFSSTPKRVLRLFDFAGGRVGPVSGAAVGPNKVIPILTVSSPTSAVYLPGSSRGFFVQDVSSFDREEISKFIGDSTVSTPRTDKGSASITNANTLPAANVATGDQAEMYPGNPADTRLLQEVRAEYTAQSTMMGVQLTIEIPGDPTFLPGEVSAVRGIGARLEGNYSALKTTHTLSSGGYTTTLECVSNVAQALKNGVEATGPTAPPDSVDDGNVLEGRVRIPAKSAI